jgi:hypothetical protein
MIDERNDDFRDDTLVEEARRAGQAYVDSFRGDWTALVADLRRRAREAGRTPVSMPPRKVEPMIVPTKKAG